MMLSPNISRDLTDCSEFGNSSCPESSRAPGVRGLAIYLACASGMLVTVVGNLLVIIVVSHFKALHTPTNLLLLSLALADLLLGLTVLPFSTIRSVESCWYFGDDFCRLHTFLDTLFSIEGGLGHFLEEVPCVGSCQLLFNKLWGWLNFPVFFFPCLVGASKRERKAAKTLRVAVGVYLLCWLPFTIDTMVDSLLDFITPPVLFDILIWLAYFNSACKPLIYVFSYRWFRKAVKLVLTRGIFCSRTSTVDLYQE
ncbi:PREDICTED: trace amine-associated receptor 5 [Calidris pugnax]|uniref:trace amine-associated receptor 5 n=1 Tax=Calidris pugnax TaxID=198806 RepID=UPI00071C2E5D|nr:PREDICTED: trace amine-associated receptor 5 [Calidris pugnax]